MDVLSCVTGRNKSAYLRPKEWTQGKRFMSSLVLFKKEKYKPEYTCN